MTGFFMLSGFSMYYTYNRKDMTDIKDITSFYKKRAIGILPSYYFIGIFYVIFRGTETIYENILLIPVEILGIQSVFTSLFNVTHNGGTWFISCMLFCYICFPFISECVKQMNLKSRVFLLVLSAFILLYSPIIVKIFNLSSIYDKPFFRILEFLIGVMLASMLNELQKYKFIKTYLFNAVTLIVINIFMIAGVTIAVRLDICSNDYMMYSWICLPVFILTLLILADMKFKECKLIVYLSNISFGVFLAQFILFPVMKRLLSFTNITNNIFKIFASLILCILIAIIIHEGVEKPTKKFLTRWFL